MFLVGLSSLTFSHEQPQRIVEIAQAAGVQGLEWHASTHCAVGDFNRAHTLREMTEKAGLVGLSYAIDTCGHTAETVEHSVRTAFEMGVSMLKVIPGADETTTLASLSQCYRYASELGLTVAVGLSVGSLAHSGVQAQKLIDRVGGHDADIIWSREPFPSERDALSDIRQIATDTVGIYCSGLYPDQSTSAIGERTDEWARYLSVLSAVDDDHWILVRGVEEDDASALFRDVLTLKRLVAKYGNE